jgi:hypothetical protein
MELKRNPVARRQLVRPVIGGRVTIISGGGNGGNRPSRMPKTAAEGLAGCLIYPRHNLDSSLTRRTVAAALAPAFWALVPAPASVSISQAWPGAPRIGHPRLGAGTPASAASNITAAAARRNPERGIIPISGPPEIRALGT